MLLFPHSLFWYQHQAFSYVHAVMTEDQYTEPDREEVSRATLDKFQVCTLIPMQCPYIVVVIFVSAQFVLHIVSDNHIIVSFVRVFLLGASPRYLLS